MSQVAPKQLSAASASDGQVLTYDSATSTWGPEAAAGGGLELVETIERESDATHVTFSGLEGNSVVCYVMFAQIAETLATNPSYYLSLIHI